MTTVRAVILITIGLFMAACTTNGDAERYARLVEEWQGRTIEFPSVMAVIPENVLTTAKRYLFY